MTQLFFELIQITLGNRATFSRKPTESEWVGLYQLACKQSLESFLLEGVNKAKNLNANLDIDLNLLLEWIGVGLQTENQNIIQNERSKELCRIFAEAGFRGCILKGQGTALYYENPEKRQCGDIDIWVMNCERVQDTDFRIQVSRSRDDILDFARSKRLHIGHVDIKHSDIEFFEDVPVEVHFLPSWMYCPSTNKRLQKFFASKAERQFANIDEKFGFAHTTIDFDLVYSMVHIYRHIFSEGIGFRQLVDYFYILQHSTEEQRQEAFAELSKLRMKSFVGGIMWILTSCFGMKGEYVIGIVNPRHGRFLLSEIMSAGNFGQYDDRTKRVSTDQIIKRGFAQFSRNVRFLTYYPTEVFWSPIWKTWHWGWRKWKKYL